MLYDPIDGSLFASDEQDSALDRSSPVAGFHRFEFQTVNRYMVHAIGHEVQRCKTYLGEWSPCRLHLGLRY